LETSQTSSTASPNRGLTLKIFFDTNNGVAWAVRVVFRGDAYGPGGAIIHDDDGPLVLFYDTRKDGTDFGRPVGGFTSENLLKLDVATGAWPRNSDFGLGTADAGGIVSDEFHDQIRTWVAKVTRQEGGTTQANEVAVVAKDIATLFPNCLQPAEDHKGHPLVSISVNDMAIHDPYLSSCGRFAVSPDQYQLTHKQAQAMVGLNKAIDQAADDAINAGCLAIQDFLGVTQGDLAGVHFSGGEQRLIIEAIFRDYAISEVNFAQPNGD